MKPTKSSVPSGLLDLLPCPFCGAEIPKGRPSGKLAEMRPLFTQIYCDGCGTMGPVGQGTRAESYVSARLLWNTRVAVETL
jgi:hypothetical protein